MVEYSRRKGFAKPQAREREEGHGVVRLGLGVLLLCCTPSPLYRWRARAEGGCAPTLWPAGLGRPCPPKAPYLLAGGGGQGWDLAPKPSPTRVRPPFPCVARMGLCGAGAASPSNCCTAPSIHVGPDDRGVLEICPRGIIKIIIYHISRS